MMILMEKYQRYHDFQMDNEVLFYPHHFFPDVPNMAFPLDFEAFPLDHSILSVPFFWKGGSGSQRVDLVGSELRSAAPHDFEALLVPQVVPVVPWGNIKPK